MKRKLCLLMLIVTVHKSQGFGHSALKGGSYSGSYSSSSASSAASSFSNSYSSGGVLDLAQLKHAGLAGSSAFAQAGAGAGAEAKASAGAGAWAGAGAGAGSVSGSGAGTYGSNGGCGGVICTSNNAGTGSGAGVADSEEGTNIIPGSGSKPGSYSSYPGTSSSHNGASNSGAHFPYSQGASHSSSGSYGGATGGTFSPSNKDVPVSSSQPGAYRPLHSSSTEEDDGSYKFPSAHGKPNSGAYSSGQVAGPFPGPQGSIHDSKPAPPGGGGPDATWLVSGSPAPAHSSTKISGLSPALISSLPGAPGSIHTSRPSGPSGSAFISKPSGGHFDGGYPGSSVNYHSKPVPSYSAGCGPSNPNCLQKPGTASFSSTRPSSVNPNGCSPSNPNCNNYPTLSTGTQGSAASTGSVSSGGHFVGSTSGRPASSYATNGFGSNGCSSSNPNCNSHPTLSSENSYKGEGFVGALPGAPGSIHTSKPSPSNGGCGPSNPNCSQKPTIIASYPSSSSESYSSGIGTLPGAPGSIHTSKPAPSNGGCGPSNPNCFQKPNVITSYPASSPGIPSNGGHFVGVLPGAPGSIHTSKPAPSNGGCGPSNPNCSQKPTIISSYPSSSSESYSNGIGTLPGAPGSIHTSKPAPSNGGCGPSNPNCFQKPNVITSYPASSPGIPSNGGHFVGVLPGAPGSIHTSKPAPSNGGCGPSNPNCSQKPTIIASYPSSSSESYSNGIGTLPGAPGSIHTSKPAPSNGGCGPSNPTCAQTPTIINGYPSSSPGITSNGGHVVGNLPGAPGSIHTSKPAPSNGGCGPSNPNCSQKPTVIASYPSASPGAFSNGGHFGTIPAAPGNIYTSKPAPSSGCGPFNPTCSDKPAKTPGYHQTSPVTTGFSHVVDKLPGPKGSIHESKPAPLSGNKPVFPPLLHDASPGAPGNKYVGSLPPSPSSCTKAGGCNGLHYSGVQSTANAAADAGAIAGSLRPPNSNNGPSSQPIKPIYESSAESSPESSDNKPSDSADSTDSETHSQIPSSGTSTETPVIYTSKPVVLPYTPSAGIYQTNYSPNGPDSESKPVSCPFGSPDCLVEPSQPVDIPKTPDSSVESSIAYPGTGNLPVSDSTANSYNPGNKEIENRPIPIASSGSPTSSCVGTACQNPSFGGKPSGPGGLVHAGAGAGSFENGYQGTYSIKPSNGCKGGSCGYPAQPSSGCVGRSCTSTYPSKPTGSCSGGTCGVSPAKFSSVYPSQPSSGSSASTYPGVPSGGCSGANCGGGINGYSGSPASDSDDGYATGSVLIHKGDGKISYGTDKPYTFRGGSPSSGCVGDSCTSSYPSQPTGGCVGGACGIVSPGKPSSVYHNQPSSGSLVATYPAVPSTGCSGGSCGSGANGYSSSPSSGSDDGFATGSVLVHKGNGETSYGNDNPGSYSYSGNPAGGCSGGSCGSSGASSGRYSGAGGAGTFGSGSQGSSGNNGCSGSTCGAGGIGGSHAISGSFSGSGSAGGSGSGCGNGKCGGQALPGFGGGFGASGAYSSTGSGSGFGLPDLLGPKGLNGAFSKAFGGSASFAKAGASAASYSGAVASSSSGSYSSHH